MTSPLALLQNSSLIWLMASGLLLGALHALEPGHAKTMIASFVVATRGTAPQAVLLGLSAAISHSALIWVLALAGLYFGNAFIGDDAEPWMQLGSGIFIVAIGLGMAWRQMSAHSARNRGEGAGPHGGQLVDTGHGLVEVSIFEDGTPPRFRVFFYNANMKPSKTRDAGAVTLQTLRPDGTLQKFQFTQSDLYVSSIDSIPEPHEFEVVLTLSHGDHSHQYEMTFVEHDHRDHGGGDHHHHAAQDAHAKAHARQISERVGDKSVSSGEIVLFGLSSGLMPCPAALTMLLVCLRLKKIALGIGLVTAFSLGLAITLVLLGVVASISMAFASRRLPWFGRAMTILPYVSSVLIIGLGVFTGLTGYTNLY